MLRDQVPDPYETHGTLTVWYIMSFRFYKAEGRQEDSELLASKHSPT